MPLPKVSARAGRRHRRRTRARRLPRAPGALRVAAERPDRERAGAARSDGRTATASPAATRRAGGCSRTSARSAVDIMLDNEDGEQFHPDASERCGDGPGFFSNRDIAYVFTGTSRGFGEVLVLRGARAAAGAQLRYWSFCQYEPATQRVIACRAGRPREGRPARLLQDRRLHAPGRGRGTRAGPAASPGCRGARRRRGSSSTGTCSRAPSFRQAIQHVGEPGRRAARVMRRFYPRGRYLTPTRRPSRGGAAARG